MNICYLIRAFSNQAGTESYVDNMARALAGLGHHAHIISLTGKGQRESLLKTVSSKYFNPSTTWDNLRRFVRVARLHGLHEAWRRAQRRLKKEVWEKQTLK